MIPVPGIFLPGMGISSPGIHLTSSEMLMIAYLETFYFLGMEIDGRVISYLALEISLKPKVTYELKRHFLNVFGMRVASLRLFLETKIKMRMKIL